MLIANRGEVARRVIRAARAMGIRAVAVYVDADAASPYVTDADESVRLATSYLDADALLAAAAAVGADAVHPGYGYLAESAAFAAAVEAAGLRWVGPPSATIAAMGDKLAAKREAAAAGLATLPSTEDPADAADRRLPAAGQGRGRRRRQGDARRRARRGPRRRGRRGLARGASAPSATAGSSWSATSRARATSRSRCSATATGTSSTSASASAPSSAATRS